MKFVITIDTENDVFQYDPGTAIAGVLRDIKAARINEVFDNHLVFGGGVIKLYDADGNACGEARVVDPATRSGGSQRK